MPLLDAESLPRLHVAVDFNQTALRANDEVINIHCRHFFVKPSGCFRPQCFLGLMLLALVEFCNKRQARREETFAERRAGRPIRYSGILAEKFEVLAIVEHIEEFLVPAWTEKIGPKPCPAPDHLPEKMVRGENQLTGVTSPL
jgi:hypothetical protein